MLRNLKELEHCKILASDGEIGQLADVFFQDKAWVLRYFVVETGSWLSSRKVLISPLSVHQPEGPANQLSVSLTKHQVKNSPDVDTEQPVSRQHEAQMLSYYAFPYYWQDTLPLNEGAPNAQHNTHLRSCKAVTGYHLHATDGDIGHVSGYLVDDASWAIRYLIIDTSNWWMGHKVLIAPAWIKGVHWAQRSVTVDLTRAAIQGAPAFDERKDWSRPQEISLHQHHRRSGYWASAPELVAEH